MSAPENIKLDIEAARVAIASIQCLNLHEASIDQIEEALIPVLRGYVVAAPRLPPGTQIFRARLLEKPSHLSELLYPPIGVSPLGRVNRAGASVLYCSTSREPSFFELEPDVGDAIVLSQWATTRPMLVNHVGYSPQAFQRLGSNRVDASWERRPIERHSENNGEIIDFLSSAFTERIPTNERHRYKLSIAIAEKLFSHEVFDGLLYPSIAMRANGDNLAIKPPFADSGLRFVRAEFGHITAVRDLALDRQVVDTAVMADASGAIQWRGRLDHWVLRNEGDQLTMTAENGRWVARDVDGNIVEPE